MNIFKSIFGQKADNQIKLANCNYNDYFDKNIFNETPLTYLSLGEITIPTGQIIVCDPLVYFHNSLPFNKRVRSGKYPVTVCIAKTKDSGDRYAVVKLEISKTKATKWELAITDGQDVSELKDKDEFFGFPVDAGLGCFMDLQTRQLFNEFDDEFMKQNPDGNIYDDLFADEFKKNALDQNDPADAGDWLNFHLPNKPELNIIMFHSGYGDGVYPSYWGTNDMGEICSLIVDFGVL